MNELLVFQGFLSFCFISIYVSTNLSFYGLKFKFRVHHWSFYHCLTWNESHWADPSHLVRYGGRFIAGGNTKRQTTTTQLEKVFNSRLNDFIEKHGFLSDNQYGFRSNRSASQALIGLIKEITNAMDKKKYELGLFIN